MSETVLIAEKEACIRVKKVTCIPWIPTIPEVKFFSLPNLDINMVYGLIVSDPISRDKSKALSQAILKNRHEIPWRIRNIIHEIKVASDFLPNPSFKWVARETNMAAHALARWSLQNRFVGTFEPPTPPPPPKKKKKIKGFKLPF